jgi:TP901 family phage tail tape measure protein
MADPRVEVVLALRDEMTGKLRTATGQVSASSEKMYRSLRNVGLALTAVGIAGVFASNKLVEGARVVERGWGQVATLLDEDVAGATERYGGMVKELTTTLAVQGGEVATLSALYQALSGSMDDVTDLSGFMETALKAATAGAAEAEPTVKVLVAAVKAYREENLTAGEAADQFFTIIDQGITTMGELSTGMGRLLAATAEAEIPLEDITGAIATLTGEAFNTDDVMTALRGTVKAFIKPSEDMVRVTKSLGFESASSMVKSLGFAESLRTLTGAIGDDQEALARLFPDIRALNAVLPLAGGKADIFAANVDRMKNSAGAMDAAFKDMASTTDFAMRQLENRIQMAADALGNNMGPAALATKGAIAGLMEGMVRLDDATGGALSTVFHLGSTMMAAIGPMVATVAQIGLMITARQMHTAMMAKEGIVATSLAVRLKATALAAGMIIGAFGALVADSPAVRATFAAITGALVAYKVATTLAAIATWSLQSAWTLGVAAGVAVASTLAIVGSVMHADAQATKLAADEANNLNAMLGVTSERAYQTSGGLGAMAGGANDAMSAFYGMAGATTDSTDKTREAEDAILLHHDALFQDVGTLEDQIAALAGQKSALEAAAIAAEASATGTATLGGETLTLAEIMGQLQTVEEELATKTGELHGTQEALHEFEERFAVRLGLASDATAGFGNAMETSTGKAEKMPAVLAGLEEPLDNAAAAAWDFNAAMYGTEQSFNGLERVPFDAIYEKLRAQSDILSEYDKLLGNVTVSLEEYAAALEDTPAEVHKTPEEMEIAADAAAKHREALMILGPEEAAAERVLGQMGIETADPIFGGGPALQDIPIPGIHSKGDVNNTFNINVNASTAEGGQKAMDAIWEVLRSKGIRTTPGSGG